MKPSKRAREIAEVSCALETAFHATLVALTRIAVAARVPLDKLKQALGLAYEGAVKERLQQ